MTLEAAMGRLIQASSDAGAAPHPAASGRHLLPRGEKEAEQINRQTPPYSPSIQSIVVRATVSQPGSASRKCDRPGKAT